MSFIFVLNAYAQEKLSNIDDIVAKMKMELNLTQRQIDAIKPIINENLAARKQFRQNLRQQGITDVVTIKNQMEQLNEIENQRLSHILSQDQMNKWIEKEHLREMLNPDKRDDAGDPESAGGHRHGRHGAGNISSSVGE